LVVIEQNALANYIKSTDIGFVFIKSSYYLLSLTNQFMMKFNISNCLTWNRTRAYVLSPCPSPRQKLKNILQEELQYVRAIDRELKFFISVSYQTNF